MQKKHVKMLGLPSGSEHANQTTSTGLITAYLCPFPLHNAASNAQTLMLVSVFFVRHIRTQIMQLCAECVSRLTAFQYGDAIFYSQTRFLLSLSLCQIHPLSVHYGRTVRPAVCCHHHPRSIKRPHPVTVHACFDHCAYPSTHFACSTHSICLGGRKLAMSG